MRATQRSDGPPAHRRSQDPGSGETVTISWAERQELLARLRPVESAAGLVDRFKAVGTSQPVELDQGDVELLAGVLLAWQQGGGAPAPDGIRSLAALVWLVRGTS
jgi:hypothetical protein